MTPKKRVPVCPHCNSTDISNDFSNPGAVGTGLFSNTKKCNRCGYAGTFFPEMERADVPAEQPLSKVKKRPLATNIYHENIWKWWRIGGWIALALYTAALITGQTLLGMPAILIIPSALGITLSVLLLHFAKDTARLERQPGLRKLALGLLICAYLFMPVMVSIWVLVIP